MTSSSNTTSFATLTQSYPSVSIASGTAANTVTQVTTGNTNASVITDILFRNLGSATVNFDIYIGSTSTAQNKIVQIQIPGSAGNNGTTQLASLAALGPYLFDLDLAGNRVITLESGMAISVANTATTSAAVYIMAKQRNF
ncbi:hypothetical protein [uncultured Mucilaginibacter sp.]|uniref:hypothetical protein n=1 Tax=uncultured Mucilaginibacter sp. TaxID=797541 RepID=UPI0025E79280|nr:hypothetical protein [uncultured Mucilaginibacter sp.]